MIITHIIAENVLKYQKLELVDLPRQGLITIFGENESGKSSIGETICFALFGRTFSIDDDDLKRIICWGESRCSAELGFETEGEDYVIARFLDDEGNHGARLYPAGEPDRVLAKGSDAVRKELNNLIGYEFNEFVESFYLAQREITTPHPHSHAVKTMAGITALEKVGRIMEDETSDCRAEIPEMGEQLDNVSGDLEGLKIEPEKLAELEARAAKIESAGEVLATRESELRESVAAYEAGISEMRSARIVRTLWRVLTMLAILTAVASAVAWWTLARSPESGLGEWIKGTLSWGERAPESFGIGFGIFGVIALGCWYLVERAGSKVSTSLAAGEALAEGIRTAGTPVPGLGRGSSGDAAQGDTSTELVAIRECRLDAAAASAVAESAQGRIAGQLAAQKAEKVELGASITEEQDRVARADGLSDVVKTLTEKMDGAKRKIEVREIADELIKGSAHHISQRFNKDLRDLASKTLPLLTEDRYEHLLIDSDLNVKVFSSQKRDFMNLEEISSGTQRQIMLAVRLALSQELVNTTGCEKQFIFLDEPFAFFDPTRTRNAMAALPELSDQICQIWVVAQEFPEGSKQDVAIECRRAFESMVTSEETDEDEDGANS